MEILVTLMADFKSTQNLITLNQNYFLVDIKYVLLNKIKICVTNMESR